ncbi:hypothetical protein [Profundibacter amoris]|uniref:YiaAB two helix domain-containing protein n=1 Tax=Profundibacter amoris TaxID=2171755 RepID=A0A347UIP6_9RHOB|nr:hypothetical protein [Profundibacter amoris]AXX98724.1 hypothetical protein BAR1_12805 [Profundibacter amoris]
MLNNTNTDNKLIILLNAGGVIAAYVLLIISLYKSTEVPLATKGFWGIGVLMLTISLVNFVKYLFDARMNNDRIRQLEDAKNEKLLEEFVTEVKED